MPEDCSVESDRLWESRSHSRPRVAGSGVSACYKSNGVKCTSFLVPSFLPSCSVAPPRFSLFTFNAISSPMVQGRSSQSAHDFATRISFPSVLSLLLSSRSSSSFSRVLFSRRRPSQDGNRGGENQSPKCDRPSLKSIVKRVENQ